MQPIRKIRFAIGIQARSTSSRLPNKVFADIAGKPMLQWVIDAAKDSASYNNRPNLRNRLEVSVCVLAPDNDPIRDHFHTRVEILEGDENDVLSRYVALAEYTNADYVVRITGDCPLIPPPVISKAITVAHMNKFDYVSNVDERLRVSWDGMDVEVISSRLLKHVNKCATDPKDREHVTTFIRRETLPDSFTMGHIVGFLDLSDLKLSVDTEEDLIRVRKQAEKIQRALALAKSISGGQSAHRF